MMKIIKWSLILTIIAWTSVLIKGGNWQLAPLLRGKLCHCDHVPDDCGYLGENFRGWGLGWWSLPTHPVHLGNSFYLSRPQLGSDVYSPFPFRIQILKLKCSGILGILIQNMRERLVTCPRSQALLERLTMLMQEARIILEKSIHVDLNAVTLPTVAWLKQVFQLWIRLATFPSLEGSWQVKRKWSLKWHGLGRRSKMPTLCRIVTISIPG